MIIGHGSEHPLMIIGDYPGKDEINGGKALNGYAGKLMSSYLSQHKIKFDAVYKTLYVKDDIPKLFEILHDKKLSRNIRVNGAFTVLNNLGIDLAYYTDLLVKEIFTIKPKVIIAYGELALQVLTGEKNIDRFRGSILYLQDNIRIKTALLDTLVVPIVSPRTIAQQVTPDFYTRWDVAKAVSYLNKKFNLDSKYKIWVCRHGSQFVDFIKRTHVNSEFCSVDIETFLGFITCIGFCFDGKEAISIPLLEAEDGKVEEKAILYRYIKQFLSSDFPKIGQNVIYDDGRLSSWGFILNGLIDDTMLLAHTCYPELPKGLDFLTSIHTDLPYYKDEGKEYEPKKHTFDRLLLYNAKDCLATWHVYNSQISDAKTMGLWDFHRTRVWPLYNLYKKVDRTGIKVDEQKRLQLYVKYSCMFQDKLIFLRGVAKDPAFNINSPNQLKHFIYELLQCPKVMKIDKVTRERKLSTDEQTIEELILNYGLSEDVKSILYDVLACRKLYRIVGFCEIPFHSDGRMRTHYKVTGTESGRTSTSETDDFIWICDEKGKYSQVVLGTAFQKIPKHGDKLPSGERIGHDLRDMFIPSDGYVFIEADKSQAEARVVCVLAEDYTTLDLMNKTKFQVNDYGIKDDLHTITATWVLDKPFEEITEDDRQDFGKKPRHAGNYDMGPYILSLLAHIPVMRATEVLTKFHQNAPRIKQIFHEGVISIVKSTRQLQSPHGRIRQFLSRLTDQAFKEAYSFIPQAVVSDSTKEDFLIACNQFPQVNPLFEAHDGLLFEVPIEQKDEFIPALIKIMERPISFRQGSFIRDYDLTIPAEVKWSDENWRIMKKVK